ncbi:MAG TPA: DUF3619 family protein [Casimicrobiaceae bacterium]|nr:DUF3619 family protein [Casimicrobiaceae bacterium]
MNEHEIAKKITGYLDQGAAALRSGTLYRLQQGRQDALARFADPRRAAELAVAGAGGGTMAGRPVLADVRLWIGVLLIVGGVLYYQYWQSAQQARDIEETDAAILTSELPIEAYLDRGFQNWLKHSEP